MTLGGHSKIEMIRTFGKLSLMKIIELDYPSVGDLKRSHGVETTEKVIAILMFDLSAAFDGVLDKDEVAEICAEVTSSILGNLTLEDIFLVCRKIKTSKQFGKLSINKVLSALNDHFEKRLDTAERYSQNQALAHKAGSSHIGRLSTSIDEVEINKSKEALNQYLKIQERNNGKEN